MITEGQLIRALVLTGHLSVPDRQLLPAGRARASVLRTEIAAIVEQSGQFPPKIDPADDFQGGLLRRIDSHLFRLLCKAEIAYLRYEPIWTMDFTSLQAGIDALIRAHWPGHIDGVPIDWSG